MAPTIVFNEPHPSVDKPSPKGKRARIGYGRGGAGNYVTQPSSTSSSSKTTKSGSGKSASIQPAPEVRPIATEQPTTYAPSIHSTISYASSSSSQPSKTFSGRGGAGNARPLSERRIFSFDEELDRLSRLSENAAGVPVFHIGRGGAGNTYASSSAARGNSTGSEITRVQTGGSASSSDDQRARKAVEGIRGRLIRAFSRE